MRRHAFLVVGLIAALSFSGICCCSSTPAEPEPLEGPDEPDMTAAGWEGSGGGRAPVVIYPEGDATPVSGNRTARRVPQASQPLVRQPVVRSSMNDFVEENRRLRQRVDSLSREVDGLRDARSVVAVPEQVAPIVVPAAAGGGSGSAAPVPARAGLSVEAVQASLAEAGAGNIQVARSPQNEVYLTLPGRISFAPGKADLRGDAQKLLARAISELKADYPRLRVRVEGHTDSDPIRKSSWPSNMALSKARADAVAAHVVRSTSLTPAEVESRGFGETRPVASNTSKEGKAQNRRCEIVLLR